MRTDLRDLFDIDVPIFLNQEMSSTDVIYQYIDEFVETVDRLQQTLVAAPVEDHPTRSRRGE